MGRRKHRGKARVAGWWRVAAVVGVVVAVVGWGTAVVVWRSSGESSEDRDSGVPRRLVSITAPLANGQVSQVVEVSGAARGLQAGEVVWIVIRRTAQNASFYPASGPCLSSGDALRCPDVRIGGTAPTGTFELVPIVVGGEGQRALVDYLRMAKGGSGAGMAQLPPGILEQGPTVTVSRRS